jgi:hypothetical protein
MTLNRQRVSKAMEDFAAGRPGSPDGFRTVVHEMIHASGRQDPGDGAWYSWTSGAKPIEEGFTELGARLISGQVAAKLGWSERPVTGGRGTLAAGLAAYGRTSGLREGLGFGTYHSYVATCWAWCEDLAKAEGFTGAAARERARELAVMIAGAGSKEKPELMADLLLKAKGRDPLETVTTKGGTSLSARELTMKAIQSTWRGKTPKTAADPVGKVLRSLATNGVKL